MLKHSLLSEGVFQVTGSDGVASRLSLPQVLARLTAGEDLAFDALRPHQRPAWHAFLVQLAYLALEDDEEPSAPCTPEAWAERLRALTPGHDDDAPWCLINGDWQRPAFLQAPCSAERNGDFCDDKHADLGVQAFDVLDTARNHDEKTGKLRMLHSQPDVAVYGLVSLQGWAAYGGRGLYNSMRMNGGVSSRPHFRLVYERGSGKEFMRDVTALLEQRDAIWEYADNVRIGTGRVEPHRLIWLLKWDQESIPIADVHPLCLEVSRRVRMDLIGTEVCLRRAGSNAMRIDEAGRCGNVLDPWTPVLAGDPPRALSAQIDTLSYKRLPTLLFDRVATKLPMLAAPSARERAANRNATLLAQVVVRVKRGTEGLLCREIEIAAPMLTKMVSAPAALARQAERFVMLAGQSSGSAYRGALMQFVAGKEGFDRKNRDFARAVDPMVERYEQAIDEAFFSILFSTIEQDLDDTDAQRRWVNWLAASAHQHLSLAVEALPTRDGSRLFARVRAETFLRRSLRKQFGELLGPAAGTEQAADPSVEEAAHD